MVAVELGEVARFKTQQERNGLLINSRLLRREQAVDTHSLRDSGLSHQVWRGDVPSDGRQGRNPFWGHNEGFHRGHAEDPCTISVDGATPRAAVYTRLRRVLLQTDELTADREQTGQLGTGI